MPLETELVNVGSSLVYAIIAAIIYALIGYAKRAETTEIFDGEKFITTLVVGVIAGVVSYFQNISPSQAVVLILADSALVYYIENVAKAIWRRFILPWIQQQQPKPT